MYTNVSFFFLLLLSAAGAHAHARIESPRGDPRARGCYPAAAAAAGIWGN